MARKQLGKYEITERLGRGGMAEVFKAYQPSLDRYVAVKLLHPFLADDPEFKERFEREARNVARLRHPNIVQVYDFEYDTESESYYMVMEFIAGQTLKDYLTQLGDQRMSINEVLRIMRGSTEALSYAHARGMIHRDVKPANLMLDSDGRIVLTDFGIAKIVTGIQFTASGGMVGTPAYMAPEQGLGEAGDERSDIYSLGIILFQLMTGRLPYEADTPLAVILKHLNEDIPSVRALNPEVPPIIEEIIYKAMAKSPEDRYRTSDEMLAELNTAVSTLLTDTPVTRPMPIVQIEGGAAGTTPPKSEKVSTGTLRRVEKPDTGTGPRADGGDTGSRKRIEDTASNPALETPPPNTSTTTALRPPGRPAWINYGAAGIIGLVVLLAFMTWAGHGNPLAPLVVLFSPSATPTATFTPTNTATFTPSNTNTFTPTPSNTATFTPSYTATFTPTNTATYTPSDTATFTATFTSTFTPTPSITFTPSVTFTPTANLTATIAAVTQAVRDVTATKLAEFFNTQIAQTQTVAPTINYTASMISCEKSYRYRGYIRDGSKDLVSDPLKDPQNGFKVSTEFTVTLVIRNTSTCSWLPGAFLTYSDGEAFGAPHRIDMDNAETVNLGEDAMFTFKGFAPAQGKFKPYTGNWQLRLNGAVLVDPPLEIAFFIHE